MSDRPIADHAMLSDCHSAALVDRRGSVEWWCAPRFDSPSVFARLLDDDGGRFAMQHVSSWDPLPEPWSPERIARRIEDTVEAWRSWGKQHQSYEGPYAEPVMHSGRVLQGLTYRPTGALVAAATTSLPETVGGERNWDYRYAWVRDASLTLNALWVAACPDESDSFLRFLTTAASSIYDTQQMQIIFSVLGERDLTERELVHLRGWRGSRPVRVGNGAWNQRQLDVYSELLSAVHRVQHVLPQLEEPERRFLRALADTDRSGTGRTAGSGRSATSRGTTAIRS